MAALSPDERRRIALTTAVRDTDAIPKVAAAGTVAERDGHRVQVMHNGVVVVEGCYYGEWMTEIIRRLRGHHEPQEEVVFHAVVRQVAAGGVMVELGSFWSYYSLWFAQVISDARTLMVEPDPRNLEVGRLNFQLNGRTGEFLRAAVGREHGAMDWFRTESDGRLRRTRMVTLEGLLDDHGIERADLVLCDAQGGELALLQEAGVALAAGRVRFLLVSTHHHSISGDPLTHQRCLALLQEAGAHLVAEHSVAESCSGDGLIAAAFDAADAECTVLVTRVRARDSLFGELEHDLARAMRIPDLPSEPAPGP